nr:hypothetical protein [Nelson Sobemo-like virus 1]
MLSSTQILHQKMTAVLKSVTKMAKVASDFSTFAYSKHEEHIINMRNMAENSFYYIEAISVILLLISFVMSRSKANKAAILAILLILSGFAIQALVINIQNMVTNIWSQWTHYLWNAVKNEDYQKHYQIMLAILVAVVVRYKFTEKRYTRQSNKRVTITYDPESMQPGSLLENSAYMPQFQVEIHGSIDGDSFYPLGQGFRVGNYLFTASHVVYDMEKIVLKNREDKEILIPSERFEHIEGDVAIMRLTSMEIQRLDLSSAKFAPYSMTEYGSASSQVVAFQKRTIGFVKPHEMMGYCTYSGSTVKGFSGAPYYWNTVVFGMHCGGDKVNIGYEGSYLHSLISPSKTIIKNQESSDQWLIDQASRGLKFQYDRSPYNPDEYRVKINGRYHMVDQDVLGTMLDRVSGTNKKNLDYEWETAKVTPISPDLIPGLNKQELPLRAEDLPLCPRDAMTFDDSKNLIAAPTVNVGAIGQEKVPKPAPRSNMPTSPRTVSESPKPLEKSHMESLPLMHAQPRGASEYTRLKLNKQEKRRIQRMRTLARRQQMEALLSLYQQRFGIIETGPLTCQEPTTLQSGSNANSTRSLTN